MEASRLSMLEKLVADLTAESGKVNLLEKMVADLTIELSMMASSNEHRRLDHNASLGSIYEFPQMGGGPIYTAGSHPYIASFAAGQKPILPGSGEKGRPTYYVPFEPTPNGGVTSVGYVFNAGDTAWMLCATALVLLMTMPGLAIYYSGMVREKNVLACTMQVFTICSLITALWMIFGYSLSFAPAFPNNHTNEVWGDGSRLWLRGMTLRTFHYLAPTIPESVYCTFQLTFAIITAALICGSFADRMKFIPMIIFVTIWHLVVYCPMAHSNWHYQGFLKNIGVLDYAGGNVVHICSGASGLATVAVVGNRKGFGKERFEPHNILLSYMGMSMLWVGWFGFNAGSACAANFNAGYAMLTTQIATAVASLTWLCTEWAVRGKPSVLGMISGAVAGLVCITPASGYVDMTGAFFIGFFGGPLCYLGAQLKHMLGYDDALDAFGVHAIGGTVGGIATGFFATDQVSVFQVPTPFLYNWAVTNKVTISQAGGYVAPDGNNYKYGPFGPALGVYYGNMRQGGYQLAAQLCGIAFALGWSFVWTFLICKVIDLTIGLRISEADEDEGMDASIHGEVLASKSGKDSDKYRVELPLMNQGQQLNNNHTPPSIEKLDTTQNSIQNHNDKKVVPTAGGDNVMDSRSNSFYDQDCV